MFKRFISLTLFWSAIILFVSSIVLYIEPHGRVAFWANWHFLGLSKHAWDDLHVCVGTLFLLTAIVHIFFNWSIIMAYLNKKIRGTSPKVNIWSSLALTLFVAAGSYLNIPPMQQLLELSEKIKQMHAQHYGNPPFGHAELVPIAQLAKFLGLKSKDFMMALKKAGVQDVSPNYNLKTLGQKLGMSPAQLFNMAMRNLPRDNKVTLPEIPPPGTGKLTVLDLAQTYNVPEKTLLKRLQRLGLNASVNETLKEIADKANLTAPEIYQILRGEES